MPRFIEFRILFVQVAYDLAHAELVLLDALAQPAQFLDGNTTAKHGFEEAPAAFLASLGEGDLLLARQ
jgi:hypothetical protein